MCKKRTKPFIVYSHLQREKLTKPSNLRKLVLYTPNKITHSAHSNLVEWQDLVLICERVLRPQTTLSQGPAASRCLRSGCFHYTFVNPTSNLQQFGIKSFGLIASNFVFTEFDFE